MTVGLTLNEGRTRQRPASWITPLSFLVTIRGAPAFSSSTAWLQSLHFSRSQRNGDSSNSGCSFGSSTAAAPSGEIWSSRWPDGTATVKRDDIGRGDVHGRLFRHRGIRFRSAVRTLWSSVRADDETGIGDDEDGDVDGTSTFPDTLGPTAPTGVTPEAWERVVQSARDKWTEEERLSPSPDHPPRHVASVTLQALRQNDTPHQNHGCEMAIRFSSGTNPASRFTPGSMRTYLDDPSMPFYRILGEWDEMAPGGDLEMDDDEMRARQQIRVKKNTDKAWSGVSMDLVKEAGCWLIERLWVDDRSTVGGRDAADDAPPRTLTVAELFDEDRLEVMSCKLADYDPARLAAEAGGAGEWLEENPNPSLSPKAVALTCIISLRHNDDGTGGVDGDGQHGIDQDHDNGNDESDDASEIDSSVGSSGPAASTRPRNEGCERVIRFCSPTNVASTLTPAHFAQYLAEPWYAILKEWDELTFHSEEISADGKIADLVVLLRPQDEEEWTSVNWELVKCNDMWLTEKIWVVDV